MNDNLANALSEVAITLAISLISAKVISHFMIKRIDKKIAKNA